MSDRDVQDFGPAVAGWVQGAPDKVRDAHNRALIWCQGTQTQIQRVRQARLDFMAVSRNAQETGVYGDDEYVEPPRRMDAEILMMFIAARQLVRALESFDPSFEFPEGVDPERVRLLRNALEHWNEEGGKSIKALKEANVDPTRNNWRQDGSGMVGDLDDRDLDAWVGAVHDDIKGWDPYDDQWLKDHGYPTGIVLETGQVIKR
jgi:hypothetical protein